MLVQEGDGESVSRDLRIDQVLERVDRGGGMIDMLRKESVVTAAEPDRSERGLETENNNWWPCKGSSGHRISESTKTSERSGYVRDCGTWTHTGYMDGACPTSNRYPLLLFMSRLDTILNPQENLTPTLRPEYVFYSLHQPLWRSLQLPFG
jgi:hypothetical protein